MPSWRRVFTSDEARVESKAGASLPGHASSDEIENLAAPSDWPQPKPPPFPADDEALKEPNDA